MKQIYQAINQPSAEQAFGIFENKWNPIVPLAVRVWGNNIEAVYQLFNFPKEIRKIIYTTNSIESYNSQLRKVLKGKGAFPNETSVMKLIYLQTVEVTKKWQRQISKLEPTIEPIINFISRSFNTLFIILKIVYTLNLTRSIVKKVFFLLDWLKHK